MTEEWTVCAIPRSGADEGIKSVIFGPSEDERGAREAYGKPTRAPQVRELWHNGVKIAATDVGKRSRQEDPETLAVNENEVLSMKEHLTAVDMLQAELRGRVDQLEQAVLTMAKRFVDAERERDANKGDRQ